MDFVTRTTLAITLPSLLWTWLRFAAIFYDRWPSIKNHIKKDGKISALHIVGSTLLVPLIPYLIFVALPPASEMVPEAHRTLCRMLNFAAFLSNITVGKMLPKPSRFAEYGMTSRKFVRALSIHYMVVLQYVAMPLQAIMMMDRALLSANAFLFLGYIVTGLYLVSLVIGAFEMSSLEGFAYEKYVMPSSFCIPEKEQKPSTAKSNIVNTTRLILQYPYLHNFVFFLCNAIGLLSLVFTMGQMRCVANGLPAITRLYEFYACIMPYITIMMMVGYFLTFQPSSSANNPFTGWLLGDCGLLVRQALDSIMTQVLPMCLLYVGPWWCKVDSEFFWWSAVRPWQSFCSV